MKSIIPRFASPPPAQRPVTPYAPTYPDRDAPDVVGQRDVATQRSVPRAPMESRQRSAAHYDAIEAARAQAMGGGNVAQRDPNLPAGSARWIVASGVGSGAGTTTVTALLSAAYAAHRRYRIIVIDANPVGGALRARLATRGAATAAEIGSVATELTSFARLAPYLDQTAEGAWAVPDCLSRQ
jgi:Mrp family chromosome partitioning ATPase